LKLQIDHRERARIVLFKKHIKSGKTKILTDAEIIQMPVGDYGTPDMHVGVEFKQFDFLESTYNDQLTKQLRELSDSYEYPYLIIGFNGILELISAFPGTNPNVIIGKLSSIASREHVTTLFCGDFLVKFVCDIVEKHYDGKTKTKDISYSPIRTSHRKAFKRVLSINEIKLDNISRIPLVGSLRGEKLLEAFDWSIGAISSASIEELCEIDGIGKKIALHIHEVLK